MDDPPTTHPEDDAAFQETLNALLRGDWSELESTMVELEAPVAVGTTRAQLHVHYVRSDPNKRPRMKALAQQLAQQVILFCIPRSRFLDARNAPIALQGQAFSQLHIDAVGLFSKQKTTGEGMELLLYSLLEKKLGIPQIMSKMSLKTDSNVHVHGTDGIHAKLLDNGNLALYWGEAKLYADSSSAIKDCFESLAPYLLGESDEDQDLFLVKHYTDTGDDEVTSRLLEYFDNRSMKSAHVEVRGACLIGFAQNQYPALPEDFEHLERDLKKAAKRWNKSIAKRISETNIENFSLEIFCVPLPNAQDFRDAIKNALRIA
jgi:hypothetical protein